jgi:hypothetical protein
MLSPAFKVAVAEMTESHRRTYWVQLTNLTVRPLSSPPLDETGVISPFMSENLEEAQHEAAVWAQFLGVPEQAQCSCVMCK